MPNTRQPTEERRCTAKSKQTGERCGQWTIPGKKVCHYHGGRGGARQGNRNAVTTGEFEKVFFGMLSDDEMEIVKGIPNETIDILDREIQLVTVREHRMMLLIQQVRDGWEEDDVQVTHERRKVSGDKYKMVEANRVESKRPQLERLLQIEDALSRVQDRKTKLLDLKHRIQTSGKGSEGDGLLGELSKVIKDSADMLKAKGESIE